MDTNVERGVTRAIMRVSIVKGDRMSIAAVVQYLMRKYGWSYSKSYNTVRTSIRETGSFAIRNARIVRV